MCFHVVVEAKEQRQYSMEDVVIMDMEKLGLVDALELSNKNMVDETNPCLRWKSLRGHHPPAGFATFRDM